MMARMREDIKFWPSRDEIHNWCMTDRPEVWPKREDRLPRSDRDWTQSSL
jgi:hypothetical protein